MTNEQEQIKRIKALIDSVDDKNAYSHCLVVIDDEALDTIKEEGYDELVLSARTTGRCWEDGAPVIKYFFREENNKARFKFEEGQRYHIAYDSVRCQLYWFFGGVWYWADDYRTMVRELLMDPEIENPA